MPLTPPYSGTVYINGPTHEAAEISNMGEDREDPTVSRICLNDTKHIAVSEHRNPASCRRHAN